MGEGIGFAEGSPDLEAPAEGSPDLAPDVPAEGNLPAGSPPAFVAACLLVERYC